MSPSLSTIILRETLKMLTAERQLARGDERYLMRVCAWFINREKSNYDNTAQNWRVSAGLIDKLLPFTKHIDRKRRAQRELARLESEIRALLAEDDDVDNKTAEELLDRFAQIKHAHLSPAA